MNENPQNPLPEEKRAYKRFFQSLPVEYKLAATQNALTRASILDLSGNGLRIRIQDKPSIDEEIHIGLDLPGKGRFLLAAKVIWFKRDEASGAYDTGIKLAETKSESGRAFMDYYMQEMLNFLDTQEDHGTIEG